MPESELRQNFVQAHDQAMANPQPTLTDRTVGDVSIPPTATETTFL